MISSMFNIIFCIDVPSLEMGNQERNVGMRTEREQRIEVGENSWKQRKQDSTGNTGAQEQESRVIEKNLQLKMLEMMKKMDENNKTIKYDMKKIDENKQDS